MSNGNHSNHNGDDSFLSGWKEISEFLHTSKSTAKRLHKTRRLPICTAGGGVFCRKEWLLEWADNQYDVEKDDADPF